ASDGLVADNKIGFFLNNTQASVVSSTYDSYLSVAQEIAAWSADRNFAPALGCGSNFDQSCANRFVSDLAPELFRRPLTAEEISDYTTLANGTQTSGDVKAGIELALTAALSSPQFIYRHEIGEFNAENGDITSDSYELTSHEMATWLSYTYTGSAPDESLRQKADADQLRDESAIRIEAQRLLNQASAKTLMGDFVGNWLGTNKLVNSPKDAILWPGIEDVKPHMAQEIREVFSHVMLDPDEEFASLYDADYTFVNATLAAHYGIDGVSGDAFQRVTTSDRGGILANGAFMTRWGESVETSPIRRSVRVRRRMLCQDQPEPPAGVSIGRDDANDEHAELLSDPTTTNRMKYAALTSGEVCSTCHREWINPMGFGMEDFDTVGNPRTVDRRGDGNLIDASGQLYAANSLNDKFNSIPFDGTKGLGALLSTLPSAQACIPKNLFRFIIGVGHDQIDNKVIGGPTLDPVEKNGYACEVEDLTNTMLNQSPRSMLESMSTMETVRYRREWAR
ncbi:MAG: gluconolactonase, partial [Alteromonadaceae bacterium]